MQETQGAGRGGRADAPQDNLGIYVAGLVNAVDKGTGAETTPYDLSPLEFNLLRICMSEGERTATQLAEVLPIDASRISRVVTRLVDMGLLRRRRLRRDRRIVMLRLTEKGTELVTLISEGVEDYDAKLTKGIGKEEMRVFVSVTAKILANYAALSR